MNVQAVVFDVFGTVVDWRSGAIRDRNCSAWTHKEILPGVQFVRIMA